ncbi:response regulator transcription factor [Colwelliaceae bacterium 6471]
MSNKNITIAYLYSSAEFLNPEHEEKVEKFTRLLNACNIALRWFPESDYSQIEKQHICFIDLYDAQWQENVPEDIKTLAQQCRVVVFNVTDSSLDEKEVLLAGIQGIFYCHGRTDIIIKGLERINKNERWFKRKTMNLALTELLKFTLDTNLAYEQEHQDDQLNLFTNREKAIFNMVSNGDANKEIADKLNINTNTVKTHIYSIYRKTNSSNRDELMVWSQQYAAKK